MPGAGAGRDAAFVAVAATDVSRLDDREYREAQLAAGLAEGRLHLAAYALGASASGMTFLDSEIPALLGEPLDGLLFTCVGVPAYRSAPAGAARGAHQHPHGPGGVTPGSVPGIRSRRVRRFPVWKRRTDTTLAGSDDT